MKNALLFLSFFAATTCYAAPTTRVGSASAPSGTSAFCSGTLSSDLNYSDQWTSINCGAGSAGTMKYQWMLDGSNIPGATGSFIVSTATTGSVAATLSSALMNALPAGVHTLCVKYTWTGGTICAVSGTTGITSSALSITVNATPSVSITPSGSSFCLGGTAVDLSVTGADTYNWLPNDESLDATTGGNVAASPAVATTYTVTGTTGTCSSQATVTIGVNSPFSISASATTVCPGETSTLSSAISNSNYNSVASITYAAASTSGATTITFDEPDDAITNVPLPFTFYFYGIGYQSVNVDVNGYITFDGGAGFWESYTLPDPYAGPTTSVALFQHDMTLASSGSITYNTLGTAPNRQFVISYNNVPDLLGSNTNSGQIVLYEGSNIIDLLIASCSEASGSTVTCGVQNQDGSEGISPAGRNNAQFSTTNEAWRFTGVPVTGYSYSWSPGAGLANNTLASTTTPSLTVTTSYTLTVTDDNSGCITSATATASVGSCRSSSGNNNALAVQQTDELVSVSPALHFNIVPNPAGDNVNVQFAGAGPSDVFLTVTAVDGKVYFTKHMDKESAGSVHLLTGDLPSGAYLVTLVAGSERITQTLVVK